jgi:ketosteroid isomerase-like protein
MSANVETVKAIYAAYARRDFAGFFGLLDPAVEIRQTRQLPWGGEYRGHDEARDLFRKVAALTETTPEPEEYVESGETVVMIGRLRGRAKETGSPIDVRVVHAWTLRDGRVIRYDAYMDAPAMLAAIGRAAGATP